MASKQIAKTVISSTRSIVNAAGETAVAGKYISPVSSLGNLSHKVSPFEQRLLVWNGRFKKTADVPALVSRDTMERARNHFRIRLNMSIGALSIVGCLLMVISGKNAIHRGENINKQNLEWHRQYNESHTEVDFNGHH